MAPSFRAAPILAVAGCAFLTGACANDAGKPKLEPAPTYEPLVTLDGWRPITRGADPFVDDPARAPACVGPGYRVEVDDKWLEIDTGLCNWVTLSQPARFAVAEGQGLELDFSHFDLDAAAPSRAELRLRFDACEAWSTTIPIPSPAEAQKEHFDSPCALAAGDEILFHLHNHGQNTYQLSALLVLR